MNSLEIIDEIENKLRSSKVEGKKKFEEKKINYTLSRLASRSNIRSSIFPNGKYKILEPNYEDFFQDISA